VRVYLLVLLPLVLLGVAGRTVAESGPAPSEWHALQAVPELPVRYADADYGDPCGTLSSTPDSAVIDCWAAYVDSAVDEPQGSTALTEMYNLACVESWDVVERNVAGCPASSARCVRPDVGLFERVPEDLPIAANISAVWGRTEQMARQYTAFQTLRSGHALNDHRPRISGLAVSQGMLVLLQANSILAIRRQLEDEGCGIAHLEPYFDLALQVTRNLGARDVPEILETYPSQGRSWTRKFYVVLLEVLGRAGQVRPGADEAWREFCTQASDAGRKVGRLDADLNVWCGRAYEMVGDDEAAGHHWLLASRSANHPDAAAWALHRLGLVGRYGTETAGIR
jgi:hypothetical protein